ncbi:snake venom 5'-nucleotidase [Aplysia californica]|uniref:5'-nucleotidase n=1 Tax=Aplysia californica TaxID=6500 RepID=A0ABM1A4G9_APLCA|nr:snake venom 5'-nucleotidase [Aplysia californica]
MVIDFTRASQLSRRSNCWVVHTTRHPAADKSITMSSMRLGLLLMTWSVWSMWCWSEAYGDFNLTILHTNDVHARIEQTNKYSSPCSDKDASANKCFGGVARLSTVVKQKRAEYPYRTILLDAGDQFQGTLWFQVYKGLANARFMNLLQYDAMAVGNHEFDDGVSALYTFAKDLNASLLSSNADLTNTPVLQGLIVNSTIVVRDGERIGVVGYTTTETTYISNPETVTFDPEIASVQAEIDRLTAQGVNKIIALGHAGFLVDKEMGRTLRGVDIIIGGHSNTFLYNGDRPSSEKSAGSYPYVVANANTQNGVLVVQDYAYGKYLGELRVTFDDSGNVIRWSGNPILLDSSVEQDNETAEVIQEMLPKILTYRNTVAGRSHVQMANYICRTEECILGNLVTDAMVKQNLRHSDSISWSDVTIAMINSGGLRTTISPGPVTVEHILTTLPFRNGVDIVVLPGRAVLEVLEHAASLWSSEEPDGGFLQVSGMQVTYDLRRPVGKRVVEALTMCSKCLTPKLETLKLDRNYSILIPDFIKNGGDGYSMIRSNVISELLIGDLLSEIVVDYIESNSPIIQGLQNRIRFLEEMEKSDRLFLYCIGGASILTSSSVLLLLPAIVMFFFQGYCTF